ncbi:MAG: hypothetical protein HYU66_08995, partial [Armatimonadetes bacterium]|nr:hypothetical protein [Armatimonadota bacterium]
MSSARSRRATAQVVLILVAVVMACLYAEQWGRHAAHRSVLKAHAAACAAARSAVASPWWTLPPGDADTVCCGLLLSRDVAWPTTLRDGPLVAALGRVARHSDSALERTLAVRRLGELARLTPEPSGPRAVCEGVRLTAQVLDSA